MISASLPENEEERIRWLKELLLLDTEHEQAYDDLARLAAQICDVPIALVSLIDVDRQWFKANHGIDVRETPRDTSFCAHAILDSAIFMVEDASHDKRFYDNPLVTGPPHIRFYAGIPLVLREDIRLGTLCVIDNKPRALDKQQVEMLNIIAYQVVSQLELRLKVKELKYLDNAKDEFISMISHELRTPLTSISGSLSFLNDQIDQLDAPMNKMVDIAYRNTGQLLGIVNDILDLAKIEAGKLIIDHQPVDLVKLLRSAVDLNNVYCQQCDCQIVLNIPDGDEAVVVMGDEHRLMQVLSNLISNSAKFAPHGDVVGIQLDINNTMAHVSVTDYGSGIPVEKQIFLFQKFRQVSPDKYQKLPGTGLGLNISKHIVELHGGKIGFESIPDEKTTFYFSLPLARD